REVARSLPDTVGPPLCARAEPLQRRTLVGVDLLHEEVVPDQVVVVLSIRDRRLEQPLEIARDAARTVAEQRAGLTDRLAADMVDHETRLARRRAHVLGPCRHDRAL